MIKLQKTTTALSQCGPSVMMSHIITPFYKIFAAECITFSWRRRLLTDETFAKVAPERLLLFILSGFYVFNICFILQFYAPSQSVALF